MPAAANQDFATFQGDAVAPVFTTRSQDDAIQDISTATEIVFEVKRFPDNAVVLTKKKSAGQIQFVTNGQDGKFLVNIVPGDTSGLAGSYVYTATLTDVDAAGPSTVATGNMSVGLRPVVVASPYDLCGLDAVKQWLSIGPADISSDAKLQSLITSCSRFILSYISRSSILPATVTERRDGYGNPTMLLRQWPVQSITSLIVGSVVIPAGVPQTPTNTACPSGYLLEPADPFPPGTQQKLDLVGGYTFWRGQQNVQVAYVAGYLVAGELNTIPGTSPYVVSPNAPYGAWASDWAVSIAGVLATKVAGSPAAGQYAISSVGNYTFAAADAGKAVSLSYGFVPTDLALACVETVAEKFTYTSRIGVLSKSLGGQETVSFSVKDLSDTIKLQLQNYRNVVPM